MKICAGKLASLTPEVMMKARAAFTNKDAGANQYIKTTMCDAEGRRTSTPLVLPVEDLDSENGEEGRALSRLHLYRERNRRIVAEAKARRKKLSGCLKCEACGFDFQAIYGERGEGFIECRHMIPLGALSGRTTTRLADLALLCANWHRMIHARRPWLTMSELRAAITQADLDKTA